MLPKRRTKERQLCNTACNMPDAFLLLFRNSGITHTGTIIRAENNLIIMTRTSYTLQTTLENDEYIWDQIHEKYLYVYLCKNTVFGLVLAQNLQGDLRVRVRTGSRTRTGSRLEYKCSRNTKWLTWIFGTLDRDFNAKNATRCISSFISSCTLLFCTRLLYCIFNHAPIGTLVPGTSYWSPVLHSERHFYYHNKHME